MTTQDVTSFYSKVSFGGLLAIYTLKVSMEKHMAFDLDDFAEKAYPISHDYFEGFIVACTSFGLLKYNQKGSIITVFEMDSLISSSLKEEIYRFAEKEKENAEAWKNFIKDIEKYFE
jgi:hypothetical protein